MLYHTTFSLDSPPGDYFLFLNLNDYFDGKRIVFNDKVKRQFWGNWPILYVSIQKSWETLHESYATGWSQCWGKSFYFVKGPVFDWKSIGHIHSEIRKSWLQATTSRKNQVFPKYIQLRRNSIITWNNKTPSSYTLGYTEL